jgi:hypothetical protein
MFSILTQRGLGIGGWGLGIGDSEKLNTVVSRTCGCRHARRLNAARSSVPAGSIHSIEGRRRVAPVQSCESPNCVSFGRCVASRVGLDCTAGVSTQAIHTGTSLSCSCVSAPHRKQSAMAISFLRTSHLTISGRLDLFKSAQLTAAWYDERDLDETRSKTS